MRAILDRLKMFSSHCWRPLVRSGARHALPALLALLQFGAFTLLPAPVAHATSFSSTQSGSWGSSSTWGGGGVPGCSDDVTINNSHVVILDTTRCSNNLTIANGGTLDLNGQAFNFQNNGAAFVNNGTLTNGAGANAFYFYGNGTPGSIIQSFSGAGTYASNLRLELYNAVWVNVGAASSLTFNSASNLTNVLVGSSSVLTVSNALVITAPVGAPYVGLQNNGSIVGAGGLKTHGDVYLIANTAIASPVEIVSDTAQAYGSFAGAFTLDPGTSLLLGSTLSAYANLTINPGAALDLGGQALQFFGSGTTFVNQGRISNSGGFNSVYFYGNGTPNAVTQTLSGHGVYSPTLQLFVYNGVGLTFAPASSLRFSGAISQTNLTIGGGSTFTLANTLNLTAPVGSNYVGVVNNGTLTGAGLRTNGNVYLVGNALAPAWSAPIQIATGVAQGYGNFAGSFTLDSGASFQMNSILNLYENLSIAPNATLDMNGQYIEFFGNGKTFANSGTLTNTAGLNTVYFYGNGTPGAVGQTVSGSGNYGSNVKLELYNAVALTATASSAFNGLLNLTVDGSSALNLPNLLTFAGPPSGITFALLSNNGLITGSGGLRTQGQTQIVSGGAINTPLEANTGTTLSSGNFNRSITIDNGAAFKLTSTANLFDDLIIAAGGTLDLNGQALSYQANSKTFSNNGTLANSGVPNVFYFNGNGTPGAIQQQWGGAGIYSPTARAELYNAVGVTVLPGTSLRYTGALSQTNVQVDGSSTLTLVNPLVITAPVGANYVALTNNGAIVGAGGLKTNGHLYFLANAAAPAFSAPVELVSGASEGYGNFAGPFTLDSGASFQMDSIVNLYDNLTIQSGASLDFNGQYAQFFGNGKTFANNGSVLNSGAFNTLYFSGIGVPGAVQQFFATSLGSFTSNLREELYNCDTLTLNGDTQLGALQIDGCSALDISGHTLKLSAPGLALSVAGLITMTNSNLELNGVAAQSVQTSLNGAHIDSLTINNPAGVDIPNPGANPLTIPATLTLTQGVFTLNNNLTLGPGATVARADGSLGAAPVFSGSINIRYFGANPIPTALEIPANHILASLTDGNTSVVSQSTSLTVTGSVRLNAGATLSGTPGIVLGFTGASFANDGLVAVPAVDFADSAQTLSGAGSFGPASTLTIKSGSTTMLNSDHQLGYLNIDIGGTFDITGRTLKLSGAGVALTPPGSFVIAGSTVEYDGVSAQTLPASLTTYNNLTLNNLAGVTGISGLVVNGLVRVESGAFTSSSTYHNVQIDSGATLAGVNGTTISVSGSWTNNGTFTPNGNTVNFTGSAPQTLAGTAATQTFNNFIVNNSGYTLTVGGGTTALTVGGSLTLASGAFAAGTAATINVAGDWTNANAAFVPGSGTVVFNGSGAQTINGVAAGQGFNNVTVNKTGVLSVGGSTTLLILNGSLTLSAGIFDAGTAARIQLGGHWTNNAGPGAFLPGSGVVAFTNSSAPQNINGSSTAQRFNHLEVNKAGQTLAVAGSTTALTLTGNLTIGAGTFAAGTANMIDAGGNWSNSGAFTPGAGAVSFDGSNTTQTLSGNTTFFNLLIQHTGSGGVTGAGSTLVVTGLLRVQSGTFTSASAFKDVQIDNGATLAGTNAATMTVGGNWTNNGAFTANGNTVAFNGSSAQTIGGSGSGAFDNLTINNGGPGVSLGSNQSVNGMLTLAGDLTTTNSYTLSLGAGETAAGSGDVIGRVARGGFAAGTRYSLGNPDVQVRFDAADIPGSLTVQLARTAPAGLTPAASRTYTLTPAGGSVYSATVRLRYRDSELGGMTEGALRLWRYDGTQWSLVGETARDTSANWVERSGVVAFSPWAISDKTTAFYIYLPAIMR